jgi:hypothetical protein
MNTINLLIGFQNEMSNIILICTPLHWNGEESDPSLEGAQKRDALKTPQVSNVV